MYILCCINKIVGGLAILVVMVFFVVLVDFLFFLLVVVDHVLRKMMKWKLDAGDGCSIFPFIPLC